MIERIVASPRVAQALAEGTPVVALETSVLAQGLPHPVNVEAGRAMAGAVRAAGAEPASVWVDGGTIRVGFDNDAQMEWLATVGTAAKVARRDLPVALAGGGTGATTVSATLWAAHRAGIEVMATGGIGGVHPGTGDVSADLLELARTPGTVVCSGPKSIVDPDATLERLEELGVVVVGFGTDRLPFFLTRSSGLPLEHRAEDAAAVAAMAVARRDLGVDSALLVCNPIPSGAAMDAVEVSRAVEGSIAEAEARGVKGKAVTPFLLSCLAQRTEGRSVRANVALLEANAGLAGAIAEEMAEGR